MVADSDKCFRVTGIPDDYNESQTGAFLSRELNLDDDVLIKVLSFARNPLRQDEWIATLSFSRIPAELSERGQQHIDLPPTSSGSRGPPRQVVIDSHFEGFTPLHTAKDDECRMDIVALSGLNGHAFGSFKAKGGPHMWLRDALPYDLRNARVFIYGYDTNPDNVSFQNVWDLESTFRDRLRRLRVRSDSTRKPFVIVAHSLGGIIAKAAVIKMAESTIEGDVAAYQSLRGTLLFGVPSGGMDIESLVPMVPSSEMRALLSSLDKNNSPLLRELGENFPKKIKELEDFETFNFYETRESPTARKNDKGNWEMKGPPIVLVTPLSATQGKLGNEPGHRVFALNRTHSEMIKFIGPNDNDYETALDCLKGIEKRIARETSVWPLHPLTWDEQGCLQSLSFLEQDSREFDPKIDASQGTCTWIREHKNYCAWLAASPGLLWIMGPPGAGKSTLMKFLVNSERQSRRDRDIIAAFFVHGRGNEIQKSHLGIYRSLLHQLLPYCPGPLAKLTELYTARTNIRGKFGEKWTWEERELRDFFTTTIVAESLQRAITVFVDALDEMGEGPAADLIAYFEQLHDKDILRHSKFRLCFSCRYYPKLAEESSLSIAVEKENSRDINSLIKTHPALSKLRLSDREVITEMIIQRANGIFQWVSLVLDEVGSLRRRGQPVTAVIARIKEVPGTLKGIYDALLVFENEHDRKQTLKLFQWILFSSEPLRLEDLRQALAIDANMPHKTLKEITQSFYYYQLEDMPTVVQSLSRGLARVTENLLGEGYPGCVETIHQSVNDYLLSSGLEDLTQPLTENPEGLAHLQMSRCCIKLLNAILQEQPSLKSSEENKELVQEHGESRSDLLRHWTVKVPLAEYAQRQWLSHVTEANLHEIDQRDLLEYLPWRKHCGTLPLIFTKCWHLELRSLIERNKPVLEAESLVGLLWNENVYRWDAVHLLALTGIHSALDKMQQVEPEIYSRMDLSGHTTILFALAGGNERIIASAMSTLANHHVSNQSFIISPLYLAVNHCREDWVQAIISEGADLDQMNRSNARLVGQQCTALYLAWLRRDDKIIRRLLSAGADPSIVCLDKHFNKTVIHEALRGTDQWSKNILPLLVESAINLYPTKKLPNLKDNDGIQSTLSYAIAQKNVRLVQILLDSGARQDCPGEVHVRDKEAFNTASRRGLEEIVRLLLNNRVYPNSSIFDTNPLREAAANGHSSIVRLLLDVGIHFTGLSLGNKDTYSCLVALKHSDLRYISFPPRSLRLRGLESVEMAVKNGHVSVVQAFLDVLNTPEADTKSQFKGIRTLPWESYLQLAVRRNFPAMVQILLKSGLDPNTVAFGQMHLLLIAAKDGFGEIARMLLHYGADPTLTDVSGVTALQTAIGKNHIEIMRMLLDWKDAHGRTLIMLEIFTSEQIAWLPLSARRARPSWVIQQVLHTEYNFNVQDNRGFTALSYAVIENMPEIVDILLDHGRSDPNRQSLQGETPLMIAASAGFEDILRRLLACPLTEIAIEDEDGLTAVDHARRTGNSTAVALLRKKQDELLAQRQSALAKKTPERGQAWPRDTVFSASMIGTLRRRPY